MNWGPPAHRAPIGRGPSGHPAAPDGDARRRRWHRWLAVPLLVLVPAGYLVVSALQSHSPAAARDLRAQMAGLVHDIPSPVQRHVYQVPLPPGAEGVGFFEANSWQTSSLYVQFTTTPTGLRAFLSRLGTTPAQLRSGLVTVAVPADESRQVDWHFPPDHHWAGLRLAEPGLHPVRDVTVDLDTPARPAVFVVSTISFARRRTSPRPSAAATGETGKPGTASATPAPVTVPSSAPPSPSCASAQRGGACGAGPSGTPRAPAAPSEPPQDPHDAPPCHDDE